LGKPSAERERELLPVVPLHLHVPLDPDGVHSFRDGVHLNHYIREERPKGAVFEELVAHERWVEPQRVDECFAPSAHRGGAEEEILVHAVLREEARDAVGVACVERSVQTLDRLGGSEHRVRSGARRLLRDVRVLELHEAGAALGEQRRQLGKLGAEAGGFGGDSVEQSGERGGEHGDGEGEGGPAGREEGHVGRIGRMAREKRRELRRGGGRRRGDS